jgi:DNA-binding response OmpR family regulator
MPETPSQESADDFWRLPFDPEQLLSQVRAALAETGPANIIAINEANIAKRERNHDAISPAPEADTRRAVLIVEDEECLRHAVSKTLRSNGFAVFEAGDGGSAITLFAEHAAEIDVVLLDITLPIMSGREVFEAINQIQPGVRVILTTAHSEEMVTRSIWTRRPWAFVHKPYRASELARLVRAAQAEEEG